MTARGGPPALRAPALWLALGVAFSPVLVDLVTELRGRPDQYYVLAAPWLLALALVHRRAVPARIHDAAAARGAGGLWVLALGLALEVTGIAAGAASLARLGLVAGAAGLARWTGTPRLGCALLVAWAVPLPDSLLDVSSPGLEATLGRAGAALASRLVPAGVTCVGPLLRGEAAALELLPAAGGLPLAWVLAGVGWTAALRADRGPRGLLGRAALWASGALLLQPLAVLGAALLVARGDADAAWWLAHGAWLPAVLFGTAWMARYAGAGKRPGREVA